ncbi:isochorismatase family cysteine hydrolase [Paraburkholderia sp. J63]|uniref:cysteine hydrolase family protein n=1 Tax=Paraburkholderia sp. J63 TaxID=2805434 RepID=UPI002ABDD419|nr:isochorismatase family cysteine hydrolase [Paraburkholderia sp. J63]
MELMLKDSPSGLKSLNLAKAALIAIHLQHDVLDADGAFGPIFAAQAAKDGLVERTRHVVATARENAIPVIYVNVAYTPDYREVVKNNALFNTAVRKNAFVRGSRGAQVVDRLAPEPDDFKIEHTRISAFYGTDLAGILRGLEVDTVIVLGIATNMAVEHTVRDAAQLGFSVVLVEDCCCSSSQEYHDAALLTLRVVSTAVIRANELVPLISDKRSSGK